MESQILDYYNEFPSGINVIDKMNEELDEAHQQTQHFKDIVPKLMECLDGTYVREFLDPLDS